MPSLICCRSTFSENVIPVNNLHLYTCTIYIYIYIGLKIKPNSVRIRFLSCQIFILPLMGFELIPLIHCSTNRLALCPAPLDHSTTSAILKYSFNYSRSVTFSGEENLEIDIHVRHVSTKDRHTCKTCVY